MTKKAFVWLLAPLLVPVLLFAQFKGGKLVVGSTRVGTGEIRIGEVLTTRDGTRIEPGVYGISVEIGSRGETQFVLTLSRTEQPVEQPAKKGALNVSKETALPYLIIPATTVKNTLVKGIASNIEGEFHLENLAPTESLLVFASKQFEVNSILGRSLDSKLVDLLPTFVALEELTECGKNCVEGYVKVTVKNEGNSVAGGKWNVVLEEPRFYVGTVSDVPPFSEQVVISTSKLKLPCCAPAVLVADVHADFYNKDGVDSNDSNNSRRFTTKLKE